MKNPAFRTALLYTGLAGGFILIDLTLDRLVGGRLEFNLSHLILAAIAILTCYFLLNRGLEARDRAEAALRQARDELETRVQARTVELAHANAALQAEIAERKQAEQAREQSLAQIEVARQRAEDLASELQLANSMLRALIEAMPAGVVVTDSDGGIILANPIANAVLGSALMGATYNPREDPLYRLDGTRLPLEDIPLYRAIHHGESVEGIEAALHKEDNCRTFVLMAASPVRDELGRVISAVAIVQDITGRKRMEQALRDSEETARALMNTSPESALLLDTQGRVLAANEIAAQRLGTTVERMVGSSPFDVFSSQVANKRKTYLDQVLHTGQPAHFEDERDGRLFDTRIHPVCDADGKIIRLAVFGHDITERKRVEQALRDGERLFHKLARVSPVGIFRTDVHGDCVYVNERWIEVAGITLEQALGQGWTAAIHPEDQSAVAAEWYTSVHDQRPFRLEYRFQRPDGVVTWVWGQALGETDDTGQIVGYVGAITDITERKRSEIELQQTQAELARRIQERTAMEERQRLARELHDSVSQSLYGISLGAHTALTLLDTDRTKVLEALNYVLSLTQAGLAEMRALIFELRPESLEMEGLAIGLGKQAAALRARYGVEVELDLCDEPGVPFAIKEALYRIAQEALQNAVKHARPDRLDVRLICGAESICLEVCDNGVGFDPMAAYPGHLGLRSMRERATRVGGVLEITSVPHCGTQIYANIPLSTTQPPQGNHVINGSITAPCTNGASSSSPS